MRAIPPPLAALAAVLVFGCPTGGRDTPLPSEDVAVSVVTSDASGAARVTTEARERMVRDQIEARGIRDAAVLAAMRRVPRHLFLPESARHASYEDHPVPIEHGQTISQPFIVALMSDLAQVKPGDRVLEIGTGSGYQAAVLEEMGVDVFSIEIVEPLAESATALLRELDHDGVQVRQGDGYRGWKEEAPFDAILLTAAPPEIPAPLLEQLAPGGRLVAPVGRYFQELVVVRSTPEGLVRETILPVRFVPMTGRAQSD